MQEEKEMASINHFEDIKPQPMMDGVTMRTVIGPDQGAPFFNMRIFELEPGAATPHHEHWWEHEVYIMDGLGIVKTGADETPIARGKAVFVPGGERHQFVNTGKTTLRFMCLVPQEWLEKTRG